MRVRHLFSTVVSTLLAVAVVTGCGTKTGKVENSGSLKSGSVTSRIFDTLKSNITL